MLATIVGLLGIGIMYFVILGVYKIIHYFLQYCLNLKRGYFISSDLKEVIIVVIITLLLLLLSLYGIFLFAPIFGNLILSWF